MSDKRDIGHGVTVWFWRWGRVEEDHPSGMFKTHPSVKDGSECTSAIFFDTPLNHRERPNGPFWQVEQWEPLTLSPSLLCRACGHHGFIRDGLWVPA